MIRGYKKALTILIQHANTLGFVVDLNYDDVSMVTWKKLNNPFEIKIQKKLPVEEKVYALLHELGHHELRKDWNEYKRVVPIVAYAESVRPQKYRRRIGYYVSCVEEEFKAWELGRDLANDLGIRIRKTVWNRLKSKCLMTYIRYFGKK